MADLPPRPDSAPVLGDDTVVRSAETPVPEALSAPLFAGRYALGRLLGRGGMGTVYEARDTLVGDTVALKQLQLDQGPAVLERFGREVRLARRISHPHVARMHDLGTHEGQTFLTMELVLGEDLRSLLARERVLPAPAAARIALAVSEGLAAAHAAGVVHRDLKPANILLESGGRVVLTDFGIARAVAGELASRTQGIVGTPMYMAPEQVTGEPVDARADLYALGLVLFEMLVGEAPFPSETPWSAAMLRLRQPPPDLRQRPEVPRVLADLVHHCLGRSPEERPAHADEVAGVLRGWLESVGESLLTRAPIARSAPTPPAPGSLTAHTPGPLASTLNTTTVKQEVALLPLRFQGPKESEFLGEALTEALIDQLTRMRGFRVPGNGVTSRFRDARDPRAMARELGVEWVVDGTVQSTGPLTRVAVRLHEARTGTQVWSGRFEHASADAFEVQDKLVPRISEDLRSEVVLAACRATTPPEAVALYRQASRQAYAGMQEGSAAALALLDECLTLAPAFLPALALHAVVSARTRFSGHGGTERELAAAAHESLQRALRLAPGMADTHLARAMRASQDNEWRVAVLAARTALDIAPFHAPSLLFLGSMQCEAGRADEGLVRLRQCFELSPDLVVALFEFARCSALRGEMEDYRWAVERLSQSPRHRAVALSLSARVAAWTRDRRTLKRQLDVDVREGDSIAQTARLYAAVVLGEADASEVCAQLDTRLEHTHSPRLATLLCQLLTEMLCLCGEPQQALGYFQRATDSVLIDLEWIERCPALESLRSRPGFAEGRRKVRTRVEAIWSS